MRHRHRIAIFGIIVLALWGPMDWIPSASPLDLHGFGDVQYYQFLNSDDTNENGAFFLGQLDLYAAESIAPRLDVLTELVIESPDGAEFVVDLERIQIGYLVSDALKLSAGRFHSPIGYWNTAYHHGSFLQTTIERPLFLRFEDDGGVLPVHSIGVLASGRFFKAAGDVSYAVQVANGSAIALDGTANVLHPDNTSDKNHNKALGLHADFTPARLRAWTLGASLYHHRVVSEVAVAPSVDVVQTIVGTDLTKRSGALELAAEYFLLRDRDRLGAGNTTTNHLYYVQVGYEFKGRLTPYARHERMSLNESDPYAAALGATDSRTETAGLRIRLGEPSVLKIEGRFVDTNGTSHHQEYAAQWAFTF
jgi:hypothetical protein